MMNFIWAGMLFIGIIFSILNGNLSEFNDGIMNSCTRAVEFAISIAGIMAVWTGLMNIAEKSGLIDIVAKKTMPLFRFLFPGKLGTDTASMMLMSFTANLFGAGNSTTVFSLKAMEMLDKENGNKETASNHMCMFLAINMSMIQLVPITVITIRNQLGSASSSDIIIPSIIVGAISMIASIGLCKILER